MTTYQSRSRGEVRTHTGFCPADFESTASANSATLEEGGIEIPPKEYIDDIYSKIIISPLSRKRFGL